MPVVNKYICDKCKEPQYAIKLTHCRHCGEPITDTFNGLFKAMSGIVKTYSANIPLTADRHKE